MKLCVPDEDDIKLLSNFILPYLKDYLTMKKAPRRGPFVVVSIASDDEYFTIFQCNQIGGISATPTVINGGRLP